MMEKILHAWLRNLCETVTGYKRAVLVTDSPVMAHGLGLEVTAEGVEQKHQADYLIALGCEYLQGYYCGRPMPSHAVVQKLKSQSMAPMDA